MNISPHRSRLAALACVLTLATAGCGADNADNDDSATEPTGEDAPPSDDAGGAAGGTTMRVYRVEEAKSAEVEGSIHVVGLLIDDGSGWRLCETVLESYPPQCGGEAFTVEGIDPSDRPLEESDGVRWQTEATVVGEVDGDTLTVTGSPAAS